jgi:hypothetical protein
LNDIGYRVFAVELDEFVKIGGSAKNGGSGPTGHPIESGVGPPRRG